MVGAETGKGRKEQGGDGRQIGKEDGVSGSVYCVLHRCVGVMDRIVRAVMCVK